MPSGVFWKADLLLDNEEMINAAIKAATAQAAQQREDGWLSGTYSDNWIPQAGYAV